MNRRSFLKSIGVLAGSLALPIPLPGPYRQFIPYRQFTLKEIAIAFKMPLHYLTPAITSDEEIGEGRVLRVTGIDMTTGEVAMENVVLNGTEPVTTCNSYKSWQITPEETVSNKGTITIS